jgi:hypothetical protein
MQHHKLNELDKKMKQLFDEVDDYLEDRYGGEYPLHPARPERGETANKSSNGLFNIGAAFSPGYGSEYGRGYVVDVDMATLADISEETERKIEREAAELIQRRLPHYFPEREIELKRDGKSFKIVGDFRLGDV